MRTLLFNTTLSGVAIPASGIHTVESDPIYLPNPKSREVLVASMRTKVTVLGGAGAFIMAFYGGISPNYPEVSPFDGAAIWTYYSLSEDGGAGGIKNVLAAPQTDVVTNRKFPFASWFRFALSVSAVAATMTPTIQIEGWVDG